MDKDLINLIAIDCRSAWDGERISFARDDFYRFVHMIAEECAEATEPGCSCAAEIREQFAQ